jgi:hypothetical protein
MPTAASAVAIVVILVAVGLDVRTRIRARAAAAGAPEEDSERPVEASPASDAAGTPEGERVGRDGRRPEAGTARLATEARRDALTGSFEADSEAPMQPGERPGSVAVMLLYIIGFALAVWAVGMTIALPVFVLLYYRFSGREPWPRSVIVAVVATAVYYAVFEWLIGVPAVRPRLF